MRRRRPARDLRTAIDCLPLNTREAMLEAIATGRIIAGAYTDRQGGVCPMLAAHRNGGRTSLASFARAWDRYTGARRRPRPATERELNTLRAMLEASIGLEEVPSPFGSHWEILTTGITVKLYPSCAATHPTLDVILELKQRHRLTGDDIASVDVEVDSMTPRLLMYERPRSGLEGKFSMPFCVAAAIVHGAPRIETFEDETIQAPAIQALMPSITMRVNPAFDESVPLSRTHVTIRTRDARVLSQAAEGARGGTARPASDDDLAAKFRACARRALAAAAADRAWSALQQIQNIGDIAELTAQLY